jgi:hypothetical protein
MVAVLRRALSGKSAFSRLIKSAGQDNVKPSKTERSLGLNRM